MSSSVEIEGNARSRRYIPPGPGRAVETRNWPNFETADTLAVVAQSGHRHREAAEQVLP